MDIEDIRHYLKQIQELASYYVQKIPGSAIALRYIKSSYQNDPVRSAVELFLFLFAVRYLLAPSYSVPKHKGYVDLADDVSVVASEWKMGGADQLVRKWTTWWPIGLRSHWCRPRRLSRRPNSRSAPSSSGGFPCPLQASHGHDVDLSLPGRPTGPRSRLSNGRTVTNLASYNFYNFVSNEALKEKAIATLRTYGVGPCGPPGFYGTMDVHMRTEADVAAHLGVPACIVYAQAFSVSSSVIPAFSKRGDIIVADSAVGYAVRKGIEISRSTVRWYEHGDMEDLERVLQRVVKEQARKPLTRRFIVTEGLFENTGDMTDLPALVRALSCTRTPWDSLT